MRKQFIVCGGGIALLLLGLTVAAVAGQTSQRDHQSNASAGGLLRGMVAAAPAEKKVALYSPEYYR